LFGQSALHRTVCPDTRCPPRTGQQPPGPRASRALLEAIRRTQAQFIEGPDPRPVYEGLLEALLDLTRSEYGFLGEVLHRPGGGPYLKTAPRVADGTLLGDSQERPARICGGEASHVYFNVDHVLETVLARVRTNPKPCRVLCDLSNTPYEDVAGARVLRRLQDELAGEKIELRVVGARSEGRDRLRLQKLQDWIGPINRYVSLAEAAAIPRQPGEPQGNGCR
jgi:hypothetical protein